MALTPVAEAAARMKTLLADPAPAHGPFPRWCVCSAPFWEHGGGAFTGACARTRCKKYRRDPADMLVERAMYAYGSDPVLDVADVRREERARARANRPKRAPGQWGVSASDLASCRRAIMYREAPPEDFYRSPESKRAAEMGSMIHDAIEAARRAKYDWREFEIAVPIPGLDASGRMDEYDEVMAEVVDFKSAGSWKWSAVGADGVLPYEEQQVQVYLKALRELGRPGDRGRVIYINRDKGTVEQFTFDYDEAKATEAIEYLVTIVTALDLGEELPRDRLGPSNDPICAMCFARDYCWDIPKARELDRSPESLHVLGDPADEALVEFALTQHHEASTREKAEKAEKALQKSFVEGLRPGRYGSMRIIAKSRTNPDNVAYRAEVEHQWSLPEGVRSPEPPPIPTTQSHWVEVHPVRASVLAKEAAAGDRPATTTLDATDEAVSA